MQQTPTRDPLAALLLAGLLRLPAVLSALTRMLGLLAGLVLAALLLTALAGVVLVLLLVRHFVAPCLPPVFAAPWPVENAAGADPVPGTGSATFTSV
jgi:hypothetical protein